MHAQLSAANRAYAMRNTQFKFVKSSTLTTRERGFSLIELAVAVVVIAIFLSSILVPLNTRVAQRKISDTQKTLEDAKEALLGFAMAYGRLPCPASATSNGVESFAVGGDSTNGNCSNFFDGFLPAVTLGLTPIDAQGYALDGWGLAQNRIRYAVSNQSLAAPDGAVITNPFTRVNGMRNATISVIAAGNLLHVCSTGTGITTSCAANTTLTANAPLVVWSVGANAVAGGTSVDEAQNPNPNGGSADRFFVWHVLSSVSGNEFDDIVTWISTGNLASRLVAARQLP